MASGSDATAVMLEVALRAEPTKSGRLQGAIRDAIRAGRLTPGDRMPATRTLAEEFGWSRNVVVDAFDQLIAEGYLAARVGDGTRVAARATIEPAAPQTSPNSDLEVPIDVDLQPGVPDLANFPARAWRRSWSDALDALDVRDLGYGDGQGAPVLRHALARYLARTRAADIESGNVLVTTGVSAALRILAGALTTMHARTPVFAVEDPGAYTQRVALGAAGAQVVPIPVDEDGAHVGRIADLDADVVVVTPAHHYPLGGVLLPERRAALVEWARARPGRLIVEDDYDAEFRYDRKPVGAIQGVAPDVTALTSSVSKTLAPGLRLGWMTLPPNIAAPVGQRVADEFATPDVVQQHALAALIDRGRYDQIIRRRRTTYRQRRAVMVAALEAVPGCSIPGAAGGLHLTVLLPGTVDDAALSRHLRAGGVDVPPLSRYRLTPGAPGLVASFATASPAGVERFAAALTSALTSSVAIAEHR
ncbi:MAG: PLP-dependent aminotransferase family protein [Actinomycetota bacterium]